MAILDPLVTTAAGALFATVGVIVGGVVTRKAQDRQWLRDKQLAAYDELLGQYARFTMELKGAHYDRRPKDYDWADWSAALVSTSLVAPKAVAQAIDNFGSSIQPFLDAVAGRDSVKDPVTEEEFARANQGPAEAQQALVNVIRQSMGKGLGELPVWMGGSLAQP